MSVADSLFAFSFAALLLTLTPGLDTALILRTATAEGRKRAFQAALGIDTGCFIWGALVAFGLGAVLATSALLYDLLKWCGAGYLFWLGIQLLRKPPQAMVGQPSAGARGHHSFVRGLLSNTLNPKMGVFYVSFLPQFIPSGHSPILWTFILVAIHVALGTAWSVTLTLTTRYAAQLLRKPRFVQVMDRVTGGVFMLFAVRLALSHR